MIWHILICLFGGYIFGNISTAYIVGKAKNIDIREHGSGNAGTTNAMRTLGKKAGIITFLGDFFKAIVPIVLVEYVIFKDYDYAKLLALYTGIGAMLGHNYPFWLKFKGGKGVAVTAGVVAAVATEIVPVGVIIFVLVALISKYISLASLTAVPVAAVYIMFESGWDLHTVLLSMVFIVFVFIRHKDNIKRLANGTENKIGQKKQKN